jgi:signal transduction histidine kinase
MIEHMKQEVGIAPRILLSSVAISMRWIFMAALPLVVVVANVASARLILVLLGWMLLSLLSTLYLGFWGRWRWFPWLVAGVDVVLALSCVALSGATHSPLWWSVLVGVIALGLRLDARSALMTGLGGSILMALVCALANWGQAGLAFSCGILFVLVSICASGVGYLAGSLHKRADEAQQRIDAREEERRREEHARARAMVRRASALNAAESYEQALEQALALCAAALQGEAGAEGEILCALLQQSDSMLQVVSAVGKGQSHLGARLSLEKGALEKALRGGRAVLCEAPAQDSGLGRLAVLSGCEEMLCLPLVQEGQAMGLILLGHPRAGFFGEDKVELLEEIGNQISVGVQQAREFGSLQAENERMGEMQEEARKKIARDLHDGPAQAIAAMAMQINFARRLIVKDGAAADRELRKVEELGRSTSRELRHMLFTLRPLILESRGLMAALVELARKMNETHGSNVVVEIERGVVAQLGPAEQSVLFFIAEEAINNAHKHAEAEHIWVRMSVRAEQCVLEVEDDGVGFNVGAVDSDYAQRGSLGMVTMRERADLVGGLFQLESTEGVGTRITVTVPLGGEQA